MPRKCSICTTRPADSVLFRFPSDTRRKMRWIKAVRMKYPSYKWSRYHSLCSQHFAPELIRKFAHMTKLHETAVPTFFNIKDPKKKRMPPLERARLRAAHRKENQPVDSAAISEDEISLATNFNDKLDDYESLNKAQLENQPTVTFDQSLNEITPLENFNETVVSSYPVVSVNEDGIFEVTVRTTDANECQQITPKSVDPDVTERALQILAERNEKKTPGKGGKSKLSTLFDKSAKKNDPVPLSLDGDADFEPPSVPLFKIVDVRGSANESCPLSDFHEADDDSNHGEENLVVISEKGTWIDPSDFEMWPNSLFAKEKLLNLPTKSESGVQPKVTNNEKTVSKKEELLRKKLHEKSLTIKSLKAMVGRLKKNVEILTPYKKAYKDVCPQLKVLRFLPENIKDLLKIFSKVRGKHKYPPQIKEFSMKLYHISPMAYNFVRRHCADYLPDRKTVRRWILVEPLPDHQREAIEAVASNRVIKEEVAQEVVSEIVHEIDPEHIVIEHLSDEAWEAAQNIYIEF